MLVCPKSNGGVKLIAFQRATSKNLCTSHSSAHAALLADSELLNSAVQHISADTQIQAAADYYL